MNSRSIDVNTLDWVALTFQGAFHILLTTAGRRKEGGKNYIYIYLYTIFICFLLNVFIILIKVKNLFPMAPMAFRVATHSHIL